MELDEILKKIAQGNDERRPVFPQVIYRLCQICHRQWNGPERACPGCGNPTPLVVFLQSTTEGDTRCQKEEWT